MSTGLPSISIVTPSFNQGAFIEVALRSVVEQNYPALEYVVMDGGSTDGSVDTIRRHAGRLAYWTSAPDGGQHEAINRGFQLTTGEIMGWLNSDDMHFPWTLAVVGEVFRAFPDVEWISSLHPAVLNVRGQVTGCGRLDGFDCRSFFRGAHAAGQERFGRGWIQQESTFWRRRLWERTGGRVDAVIALDFDLWARFYRHADLYGVRSVLGGFRRHAAQKTALQRADYDRAAINILCEHGGRPAGAAATMRRRCAHALRRRPPTRRPLLNRVLLAVGWLAPARNIVYDSAADRWMLQEALVVA